MDVLYGVERILKKYLQPYIWGFLFIVLISLITLGPLAFNIVLAGDEWMTVIKPDRYFNWLIKIGRWGAALIQEYLPFKSFNPSFVIFGNLLVMAGTALAAARLLCLTSTWAVTLFVGYFVLAPVLVESYFFILGQYARSALYLLAVCQVWATLRFCQLDVASNKNWYFGLVAVLCFVAVASIYQLGVIISLLLFVLAVLMRLSQAGRHVTPRALWRRVLPGAVGIYALGLIAYLLSVPLFQWIYDFEPTRVANYSSALLLENLVTNLGGRIRYLGSALAQFYFLDMHMVPAVFGWAILAGVAVLLFDVGASIRAKPERSVYYWSFVIPALAVLLVLPFAFGLLRDLRYTMIASSAILFAFFLAIPLERLRPGWLRSMFAISGFCLLFFSGYQLSSAVTIKRLNMELDLYRVSSIVEQLRHDPRLEGYRAKKKLVVYLYGRADYGTSTPFAIGLSNKPFDSSIVNCGIFNCQGKRFQHASRLVGFDQKVEVKRMSREGAIRWMHDHLPARRISAVDGRVITRWQKDPNAGLLVGRNQEVLVLLKDLKLSKRK